MTDSPMNLWATVELIRNSGFFDERFYLSQNPDAIETDFTLIEHYLHYGAERSLDPSPLFDTPYYLAMNPDVIRSGIHPLVHYLTVGMAKGRLPKAPIPGRELTGISGRPKLIAFYLPQFHPIPENDEWWGKGFTEWTNVTAATPMFPGHYQPRLPSELGFYDLRLAEIYPQQVALAREYGIDGFCYYYYWFNGRRILERPLQNAVERHDVDFPFCICWANESWSRRWDGRDREILLAQDHTLEGDNRFILDVLPLLQDQHYLKVDGKPILLVYRPELLANALVTAEVWRRAAEKAGLPGLHLCAVQFEIADPRSLGFDALVEFPPHFFPAYDITRSVPGLDPNFQGLVRDYYTGMLKGLERPAPNFPFYRGAMLAWDNTARRRHGSLIYHYSSPQAYRQWLRHLILQASENAGGGESLVFINAWNEWAEGAVLEPSLRDGRAYLEATRDAVEENISTAYIDRVAYERYRQAIQEECRLIGTPNGQRVAITTRPKVEWVSPRADLARKAETAHYRILFFYDRSRTPFQLAEDIRHALAPADGVICYILLCGQGQAGEKSPEWSLAFDLETLTCEGLSRSEAIGKTLEDLAGRSIDLALGYTLLPGDLARSLHSIGIPILTVLDELPAIGETFADSSLLTELGEVSERIVVTSEMMRQKLTEKDICTSNERITVIYPGIRSDLGEQSSEQYPSVLAEFNFPPDSFLVLANGPIAPRGGADLIVPIVREVFSHLGTEKFRFLWIGEEQDDSLFRNWCEHDLATLGLSDRVIFTRSRPTLLPYLEAADVFLLPAREDHFSRIGLEAMYKGLPVLAFEGGGLSEVLSPDAGVLVPYLNTQMMVQKLRQLYEEPIWRSALGERAMTKARSECGWFRYRRNLLNLLRRNYRIDLSEETVRK